jgi:hypothetical protein
MRAKVEAFAGKVFWNKQGSSRTAAWQKGFSLLREGCFFYLRSRMSRMQRAMNEGKGYKAVGKCRKLHYCRKCDLLEGQVVGFNSHRLSEKSIFPLLLVSSKRSNRVHPLRRRVINLQKCIKPSIPPPSQTRRRWSLGVKLPG